MSAAGVRLAHEIVVIDLMGSSHQVEPGSFDLLLTTLNLRISERRFQLHGEDARGWVSYRSISSPQFAQ